jgi:hypothetical protein
VADPLGGTDHMATERPRKAARRKDDVTELRRQAAHLGIDGRSKLGKAQPIRSVSRTRRFSGS